MSENEKVVEEMIRKATGDAWNAIMHMPIVSAIESTRSMTDEQKYDVVMAFSGDVVGQLIFQIAARCKTKEHTKTWLNKCSQANARGFEQAEIHIDSDD